MKTGEQLQRELNALVLEMAYAIEDPCGLVAIQFARSLLQFGRSVPESKRQTCIRLLQVAQELFVES